MTDIKYYEDGKIAEFNGKRYVRDSKTGYYLCHNKSGSGTRLHRDVWEFYNCKIPKGYEIHHKDHDKSNNDISNLQMLEASVHRKIHAFELSKEEREWRRKNLSEKARPEASKWHKSDAGIKWHSEHMKDAWKKKEISSYICDNCGKTFQSLHSYGKNKNKFCSNACKSDYRRKSGIDNIEKVCEYCGKTFISNKYRKQRFCSMSCSAYARKRRSD